LNAWELARLEEARAAAEDAAGSRKKHALTTETDT